MKSIGKWNLFYLKMRNRKPVGTVAINMRPTSGPWGGSSVFVRQFMSALKRYGYKVKFSLKGKIDIIYIIDPRKDLDANTFYPSEIEDYKQYHPEVKVVHRINECDQRKKTAFMDSLLEKANTLADHTVFISKWLRDYFVGRWFDPEKPHTVIYNGADPATFHPIGNRVYKRQDVMRIVTHHWSNNPMKGFPVYEKLDHLIANGDLKGFELWVVGRWPTDIKWRIARTFPPASGPQLADLLRQCHLYITASLWEPCGMHHVEGAQCGLPLIFHTDGGGIVEAGNKYGIGFRDNLMEAILDARDQYTDLRQRVLKYMPSGDRMCFENIRIIQKLLAQQGKGNNPEEKVGSLF